MPASLKGRDRYSGSEYQVTLGREGGYVTLAMEGSNGGSEVLLTPDQADSLGYGLRQQAELAKGASALAGELDS